MSSILYGRQTSVQQVSKIYTDSVCKVKKVSVPKNISFDKVFHMSIEEYLYEQLQQQKLRNKQLSLQLNALIVQQQFIDRADDQNDLKQAYLQIKKKEQEIAQLKHQASYKHNLEQKKQLDLANEQLRQYHIFAKHENNVQQVIQDNISMIQQIDELRSQLNDLEKVRGELTQLKAKHQQLQHILKFKELQLEKYRSRDPYQELERQQQCKNEQQLIDEIEEKKEEIQHLTTKLEQAQSEILKQSKVLQDLQTQTNIAQSQHENERLAYKEIIMKLTSENEVLLDKTKMMDRYMQQSLRRKSTIMQSFEEVTTSLPQIQIEQDQLVKSVNKSDVEQIALELKLHLRQQSISLNDTEAILFQGKTTITIKELEKLLSREPFRVKKSNLLARYIVEDEQTEQFEYNSEVSIPVVQARSIFKTIMHNYQLFTDNTYFEQIKNDIESIVEHFSKKSIQEVSIEQIWDFCKSIDLPLNSKHMDYLQQIYFDKFNQYRKLQIAKVVQIFNDYNKQI